MRKTAISDSMRTQSITDQLKEVFGKAIRPKSLPSGSVVWKLPIGATIATQEDGMYELQDKKGVLRLPYKVRLDSDHIAILNFQQVYRMLEDYKLSMKNSRTASEVLRSLEMRVAHLEGRVSSRDPSTFELARLLKEKSFKSLDGVIGLFATKDSIFKAFRDFLETNYIELTDANDFNPIDFSFKGLTIETIKNDSRGNPPQYIIQADIVGPFGVAKRQKIRFMTWNKKFLIEKVR